MNAVVQARPASLIARMAARYGVDADKMLHTLKETAFKGSVTTEQLMSLCVVAEQYDLNPWLKEIYAFPSQSGGIVPVVGVDGWLRIINANPQFDGMEFVDGPGDKTGTPEWIECVMYRKDRSHAIRCREYMAEVYRDTGPWKSHKRRMLRHKAIIQCGRMAFGFVGIYDPDEAERIVEADRPVIDPRGDTSHIPGEEVDKHVAAVTDILNADKDENSIADMLRDYVATYLNPNPEVWILVGDALAKRGIISKSNMRKYLSLNLTADAK